MFIAKILNYNVIGNENKYINAISKGEKMKKSFFLHAYNLNNKQ